MRVCPKCGFVDPPEWKHTKWSYYMDSCTFENFERLHPILAKKLLRCSRKHVEDQVFVYKLSKTKRWVQRKAKVDFFEGLQFNDGTEAHATRLHALKIKFVPSQTKLLETTK